MAEIKKYDYIDALRGWAILAVIFLHNYNYFDFGKSILFEKFVTNGQYGVQLFFIVSALTLSLSFYSKSQTEARPLLNYFIRRFFRIAPLFYTAILLYTLVYQYNYTARYLISNLLFIFNLHPVGNTSIIPYGWTIGLEMLFYAIFPIVFIKANSLNKAVYFIIISVICSVLCLFLIEDNHSFFNISHDTAKQYAYQLIVNQLPVFLLGIFLFRLIYLKDEKLAPFTILVVSVCLIINLIMSNVIPVYLLFAIVFAGLIYVLSFKPYNFFVNLITIEIGKVSFSMYLLHSMTLYLVKICGISQIFDNLIINCLFRFLIVVTGCYIISRISYELIEKNSIKAGKKLIEYLEGK